MLTNDDINKSIGYSLIQYPIRSNNRRILLIVNSILLYNNNNKSIYYKKYPTQKRMMMDCDYDLYYKIILSSYDDNTYLDSKGIMRAEK